MHYLLLFRYTLAIKKFDEKLRFNFSVILYFLFLDIVSLSPCLGVSAGRFYFQLSSCLLKLFQNCFPNKLIYFIQIFKRKYSIVPTEGETKFA